MSKKCWKDKIKENIMEQLGKIIDWKEYTLGIKNCGKFVAAAKALEKL